MGFDALYMTGYGVVASISACRMPGSRPIPTWSAACALIADGHSTPLIADADTGYGGLLNVDHTVRGYEAAGAQAIQIEDQEYPKKCGHTPGRRVVPLADEVRRIKVAVEARSSTDFLIIARTDARTALGLDEALRRGEAFLKAGADMLFVESPESEAELAKIGQTLRGVPLLANMVEGGRTPILSRAELEAAGFKLAIFPTAGFLAAGAALRSVYGETLVEGLQQGVERRTLSVRRLLPPDGFRARLGVRTRARRRVRFSATRPMLLNRRTHFKATRKPSTTVGSTRC